MKFLKNFIKWIIILFGFLILVLFITDTDYLIKAVRTIYLNGHTTAFLKDYNYFDTQLIEKGTPQPWPYHKNYNSIEETENLKQANSQYGTIAFVIIKNDSIWFENYYDDFNESSSTNSFSMAKSYVSGLLGKAIMEGHIKDLDQPVCDFFPEFCSGLAADLTVGDLASMASGSNWDEAYYSPFSITTRAYFYDDLKTMMLNKFKIVDQPGEKFVYQSGNTQLLAMVLENATGQKLYDYLEKSFWKPLGCTNNSLWQIDNKSNDMVKAYCCIASNAKDFARLGKLYKDYGKWKGQQVLDSAFVAKSLKPRFAEDQRYGYGWWLKEVNNKPFYFMWGHLGQYVMIQPQSNVIIVRLGHNAPKHSISTFPKDIDIYIEEAYKMLDYDKKT